MRSECELAEETAEELFEDAPCGYLSTRLDGTIIRVNRTFEAWTGRARDELLLRVRFQDLLSPGGRIYYETHYAPLLQMQGAVREIAVDIVRGDGSLLPALVNSTLRTDEAGRPRLIRTTVFDATDRRRYENELLLATQRERHIAQRLQRSLLAGELPASPAIAVEAFYSPAVTGTAAGGDWYDAFWLEPGRRLALVVGDVVGRGIDAAATMGQLRSAVRAFAAAGLAPAALLRALDGFSQRHRVGQMTTLVLGRLDLGTGALQFARAGHPPPLVVPPDGAPYFALDSHSLPVDAFGECHSRPEQTTTLTRGTALLLYTDGLIENRARPQADGLAELRALITEHAQQPLHDLVWTAGRAAQERAQTDDICVLGVRLGA